MGRTAGEHVARAEQGRSQPALQDRVEVGDGVLVVEIGRIEVLQLEHDGHHLVTGERIVKELEVAQAVLQPGA